METGRRVTPLKLLSLRHTNTTCATAQLLRFSEKLSGNMRNHIVGVAPANASVRRCYTRHFLKSSTNLVMVLIGVPAGRPENRGEKDDDEAADSDKDHRHTPYGWAESGVRSCPAYLKGVLRAFPAPEGIPRVVA